VAGRKNPGAIEREKAGSEECRPDENQKLSWVSMNALNEFDFLAPFWYIGLSFIIRGSENG